MIYCGLFLNLVECILYDFNSNTFKSYVNLTHDASTTMWFDFNGEYFEESERVVFSFIGRPYDSDIYKIIIFECDLEGNCRNNTYSSLEGFSVEEINTRINVVIPFNKTKI